MKVNWIVCKIKHLLLIRSRNKSFSKPLFFTQVNSWEYIVFYRHPHIFCSRWVNFCYSTFTQIFSLTSHYCLCSDMVDCLLILNVPLNKYICICRNQLITFIFSPTHTMNTVLVTFVIQFTLYIESLLLFFFFAADVDYANFIAFLSLGHGSSYNIRIGER